MLEYFAVLKGTACLPEADTSSSTRITIVVIEEFNGEDVAFIFEHVPNIFSSYVSRKAGELYSDLYPVGPIIYSGHNSTLRTTSSLSGQRSRTNEDVVLFAVGRWGTVYCDSFGSCSCSSKLRCWTLIA